MLDLAFVRGRAIWIPRENTEEEQNKEKNSEQRRAQKRWRDTPSPDRERGQKTLTNDDNTKGQEKAGKTDSESGSEEEIDSESGTEDTSEEEDSRRRVEETPLRQEETHSEKGTEDTSEEDESRRLVEEIRLIRKVTELLPQIREASDLLWPANEQRFQTVMDLDAARTSQDAERRRLIKGAILVLSDFL